MHIAKSFSKVFVDNINIVIFIFAFCYVLFFTSGVPFFWDDHQFNTHFANINFKESFNDLFSPTTFSVSSAPRATYGILVRSLVFLFGYEFFFYRAIKAVFFAGAITFFYLLLNLLDFNKKTSTVSALGFMFSYPVFIHTLVFDEPFIIEEFFKIAAFYLLFKDLECKKTSFKRQFFIATLGVLAMRSYPPGYAVAVTIVLFLIFTRLQFKRYFALAIFLVFFNFPIGIFFGQMQQGPFGVDVQNLFRFLFKSFQQYLFSPAITTESLYYLSIYGVLSFFGIWLLIISILILVFSMFFSIVNSNKLEGRKLKPNTMLLFFAFAWLLSELPILITIPETAIRYVSALIPPFIILFTFLCSKTYFCIFNKYKKFYVVFLIICVGGIFLTNIFYTSIFRATWGSAFIGADAVLDWMDNQKLSNVGVLYYATSVGDEYVPVNMSNFNYCISKNPVYLKTNNLISYSEENLAKYLKQYEHLYVIKRVSSRGKSEYPPVDFEKNEKLKLVKKIDGMSDATFDKLSSVFMKVFHYAPNTLFIYKYDSD